MAYSQIWQDIITTIDTAIADGLHLLDEDDLIDRADDLLANVPIAGGTQPTTALLLRRYHAQLHAELCVGNRPRTQFGTLEDELRELTRAVVVTIGDEGISMETSVLIALVLYARGLATFCAVPVNTPRYV